MMKKELKIEIFYVNALMIVILFLILGFNAILWMILSLTLGASLLGGMVIRLWRLKKAMEQQIVDSQITAIIENERYIQKHNIEFQVQMNLYTSFTLDALVPDDAMLKISDDPDFIRIKTKLQGNTWGDPDFIRIKAKLIGKTWGEVLKQPVFEEEESELQKSQESLQNINVKPFKL